MFLFFLQVSQDLGGSKIWNFTFWLYHLYENMNSPDHELGTHKSAEKIQINRISVFQFLDFHISQNLWSFEIWNRASSGLTKKKKIWTVQITMWGRKTAKRYKIKGVVEFWSHDLLQVKNKAGRCTSASLSKRRVMGFRPGEVWKFWSKNSSISTAFSRQNLCDA